MSFSKPTHHRRPPCIQLHHILLLSFLLLGLFPGNNHHPHRPHHLASAGSLFNKDKDKHKAKQKPASSDEELQAAQDLQDAATGTITSTPPGKTKEPVTCDEMMAKSVVEATAARDKAIAMKDSAIEMASIELKRADKLAEEIKKANIQVEAVDEEMERLKKLHDKRIEQNNKDNKQALIHMQNECLAAQVRSRKVMEKSEIDTQKKLDSYKKKAVEEVRQKRAAAKKEIAHVHEEMKELKESTAQQIKEVEEKAAAERQRLLNQTQTLELTSAQMMDEVKQMALDDVTKAKNEAAAAIAVAEEHVARVTKDAEDLVDRIRIETNAKLDAAKKENDSKLEAADEMVRTEREATEKAAAEQVEEAERDANQRVRIATAELNSYKISSAMQIEQAKKDAEELVRTKQKESEDKMTDFFKKATEKIEEANKKAETLIKEAHDQLENSQKDARRRINDANEHATKKEKEIIEQCRIVTEKTITETTSEMSKVKDAMKLVTEKSSKDITDTINEKNKVEVELKSQIKDKNSRIDSLEYDFARVKRDLEDSRAELSHWKTLHEIRSYINITHVLEDLGTSIGVGLGKTEVALRKATKAVEKKLDPAVVRVANHWEELKGKIGEIWDPYGQKVSALYDAHLKTTVDTKVRPVLVSLSKKIAVIYEKQVLPFAATVKEHANMLLKQIMKKLDAAFVSASELLQRSTLSSSKHIMKHDPDKWIPGFVHRGLQRVAHDSSWYLSLFLKILGVIVLYLFRWPLMSLVWGILCVPSRIVRFFFTPVIGSGKPKINVVKFKKETEKNSVKESGIKNRKVVKREESDISYDSDSEY